MPDDSILVWDEISGDVSPIMEYITMSEISIAGMRPEFCGLHQQIERDHDVTWETVRVIDFPDVRIVIERDGREHMAVWRIKR